ncbi:SAM-dependent methyltransferase [Ferriphaselus sp. R-1]|uniref:SAM-dependent methyltransferase n=1 Tax=Ferriphaselus sp. R-1 TaxID=1485544 RepID=UPI0005576817|nr:SAM-dependent methyltransferase [Ferriphaselus sp. R-1]
MTSGILYLIPNTLGDNSPADVLPAHTIATARRLDYFVVEHAKTARRFLSQIKTEKPLQELELVELSEHTAAAELPKLLAPLLAGRDAGLLSEAGCPGVADPGAELVALAHRRGVRVVPLVGPSSILLALMASGMNGQGFAFRGYLPVEEGARQKAIATLEGESVRLHQTQIFIETPYRNHKLLNAVLAQCRPGTRLCIATDLTLPTEWVVTRTVADWKAATVPDLNKRPSIFLLQA